MRATRKQSRCIVARQQKLGEALQSNGTEDDLGRRHAACLMETQLAVKPGPSAVSSERDGSPLLSTRSSTNSAVGADMLP
jgi:hypothetical protein